MSSPRIGDQEDGRSKARVVPPLCVDYGNIRANMSKSPVGQIRGTVIVTCERRVGSSVLFIIAEFSRKDSLHLPPK